MESADLRKMRSKQFVFNNGLLLSGITIYFMLISFLEVSFAQFFLILGIILLIQAIYGFLKGDSTKSFIPILEQVATYEKQKMGDEWKKQRRTTYVMNLIISGIMFLQVYWNRDSTDVFFHLDFVFILITVIFMMGLTNIGMLLHNRKIDRSSSVLDMKGYTWKSTLIGAVVGVIIGLAIIVFFIIYILSII